MKQKIGKKKQISKRSRLMIISLVCLIILILIIQLTLSRYQSDGSSDFNMETALFVFDEDYQEMELRLEDLYPTDDPFVYTFTISNYNDDRHAEVDLEYDLELLATTNLPLDYELYIDEDYTDSNATNAITENDIIQDEYDTYFREMKTEKQTFYYKNDELRTYTLVVYFGSEYNTINYQDIIENVSIIVNAKQIIN